MSLFLNDPQRMEKGRRHIAESILNLTLEIIYLLTGEGYTLMKITDEDDIWSRTQIPILASPPHLLKNERSHSQKILELANKIIELLTGEVPIRCQDVTVYFSMEEWEYLQRHMHLYEDVMEDHQTFTSLQGSSMKTMPERLTTILTQNCPEEYCHAAEDFEAEYLTDVKDEVMSNEEEILEVVIQQCKEEEIPTSISKDDRTENLEGRLLVAADYTVEYNATYGANTITTNIPSALHSRDLSTDPSDHKEPPSAQSLDDRQVTGHIADHCTKILQGHLLSTGCEVEYNKIILDNIQDNSGKSSNTSCIPPVHPSRDLSTDPSHHKEPSAAQSQNEKQVTGQIEGKMFTCSECGKHFIKKLSFYAHRRNHRNGKQFSCSECGKRFNHKSDLTRHQRIHTGEKPYSCSECGKCFTVKSHLVDHRKIHTGEKPFACLECGTCFARKSNLLRHQKIHTGLKPFSCSECGKYFNTKSHLVDHQRIHTGEKPFPCPDCGKCFTLKAHLMGHRRTHTEEAKIFSCPEYGNCFSQELAVVKHQKFHSAEAVCMFRL
ncbi:oocyte zinc finger protein XlCOF7.1-like [Eleutherodactylus coqui]|uniref:oocyte zinc finger protein XlCOF7.1-like n=1 Tax=Eleutherodactylus coqui TaxID=57060 RepID=UPI003461AF3A